MRGDREGRLEHGTDGFDLGIGDGGGLEIEADDVDYAGGLEDGDAAEAIEAAEDVAGEEGGGDFLEAVGPAAAGLQGRDVDVHAFGFDGGGGGPLEVRADADSEPA